MAESQTAAPQASGANGHGPLEPPRVPVFGDGALRFAIAALALMSVAPLLAWVYGLGEFASWYRNVTIPAMAVLGLLLWRVWRSPEREPARQALTAGAVGGLLGTIGYDVFRIPFLLFGLRLLAPIDSYGVLILDSAESSPVSGLAGWTFHTTNGVCFGLAYAAIAARRSWRWGVVWALGLETATVATPFAKYYGLTGKWNIIVIAYAAHVPYGYALGKLCEHPAKTARLLREIGPRPVLTIFAVTAALLVLWQRPWSNPQSLRAGEAVAPGASAVVQNDDLSPFWIRVAPGGCAQIRNDDPDAHTIGTTRLEPGHTTSVCFEERGVHRVKVDAGKWSGGFVIVDPEEDPS